MSRCTQVDALHRFRSLSDADAGRLKGQCLYHTSTPIPPGTLEPQAAQQLHEALYRHPRDREAAGTVCYVVSSDGTPVAWLDYEARVVTPPAKLTDYQRAHQVQAQVALSQLTRSALGMLARLRNAREKRSSPEPDARGLAGRVLVASPSDPTLTFWTAVDPDPVTSHQHVQALTGGEGEPLIVEAFGYGDYGRHRCALTLDMVCAMEELAAANGVSVAVVGDWLYAEGAATADYLTPQQVKTVFAESFAGVHDSKVAFAAAERDRRSWTDLLATHQIPATVFDDREFARLLFAHDFRDIGMHDYRIAVFRRATEQGRQP